MANKIVVSVQGSLGKDALASKKQAVADTLGVCPEDILFLTDGVSVSVVDLPDELTKAREKADKQAEADAEKAAEEQEKAAADQQAKEVEAIRTMNATPPQQSDVARATAAAQEQQKARDADQVKMGGNPKEPAKEPAKDAAKEPAKAAKAADDYDSWTLEDLHAEASKRDLHGRSGLGKAELVKALHKDDKGKK